MKQTSLLAKHFRDVHFGGNWTCSNLKDNLGDVTWEQSIQKVHTFNTIATLTYHIHYFVKAATEVLEDRPLNAHDKYSFEHPAINSEDDWKQFLKSVFDTAEKFAILIEGLPDKKLDEVFAEEKYGTYYRNLQGIIEHTHYHLGQIALIKKLVQTPAM